MINASWSIHNSWINTEKKMICDAIVIQLCGLIQWGWDSGSKGAEEHDYGGSARVLQHILWQVMQILHDRMQETLTTIEDLLQCKEESQETMKNELTYSVMFFKVSLQRWSLLRPYKHGIFLPSRRISDTVCRAILEQTVWKCYAVLHSTVASDVCAC